MMPKTMPDQFKLSLTSGRLLARNTIWNFLGQVAPLLVALISIPYLISSFGIDRFGVLTLVWVIIGYFSLFDLGLGRALTQMASEKFGMGAEEDIPSLVWITLGLMLLLGLIGAAILVCVSDWLIYSVLKIPPNLQEESLSSFIILSLSLPIVISTAALRGLLEAKQLFGIINTIRIPLGIFMYIGPLLVLPFSISLLPVVAVLVIGRAIAWVVHFIFCLRAVPSLRKKFEIKKGNILRLFRFGGFITLSNLVGPLMAYLDRFLIGSIISISAVAFYTTPYEIVTKLWIFPSALVGVLFPAFSACYKIDAERAKVLFHYGMKYTLLSVFPFVIIITSFASEGLTFWLGSQFATQSARIMQLMAIGIFLNCFAMITFALIQAAGKPSWTALLHSVQLPFYIAAIFITAKFFGIEGVAVSWLARILVDTLILFYMTERLLPGSIFKMEVCHKLMFAGCTFALATSMISMDIKIKLIFLGLVMAGFAIASWMMLLKPEERIFVRKGLRILYQFNKV